MQHDEPSETNPTGRIQFTLRELLLSSWVTGLLMLYAHSICPVEWQAPGLVLALILGLSFAVCVLQSAHSGHDMAFMRVCTAAGIIIIIAAIATGLLAAGQLSAGPKLVFDPNTHDHQGREWAWLLLLTIPGLITGLFLIWMSASYLAAPKKSHVESAATLHTLLDAKKRSHP